MLRGSSRHDGIPNKQSARERDRDRLRERQRQERQQMLPNDEKDINVGAQDLFHAPVKVKPSIEDSTTAQIANTLGSFDSVRHLILDTSQRRLGNLIGVDQGSLPGTPVTPRNPAQSLISGGHSSSGSDQGSSIGKSSQQQYFHPQQQQPLISGQSAGTVDPSNTKAHHRNLFGSSASNSLSNNTSATATNNNSSGGNHSNSNSTSTLASSASGTDYNFAPSSAGNFRGNNPHPSKGGASLASSAHNNQSSIHHSSNSSSSTASSASSQQNSSSIPAVSAGGGSTSSSNAVAHNNSTSTTLNNSNNSSNLTNSVTSGYLNNSASNNSNNNPNQVRLSGSSSNFTGSGSNSSVIPSSVTDVNSEGHANVPSAKTLSGNATLAKDKDLQDSVSGALDDKNNLRHASSNRKPALERADSQLEIESMLKEMMDISAPLTAIQTPVKETSAKKFTQRRSSKSEEKIVQSIRESGMADVPSPVQKMDSSGDSSSSYESETSDSESEDSSSGSQTGGDKVDNNITKIPPNTNSPTRWNLGSFIRKNDYRADANTTTTLGGAKSPKDVKPNAHQVNAINSETSPGDVPVKVEPVVSSTSIFNKAQSLSPLDTPVAAPPQTRKVTRSTAEIKSEPHVPLKPPPSTGTAKSSSNSVNNPVTKSLSSSSSEDEAVEPPPPQKKKEVSRPISSIQQEKTASNAAGAGGKRKRKRSSGSFERSSPQKPVPVEEPIPENNSAKNSKNVQDRKKNNTIRKLFLFKKVDSPTRGDNELGKSPTTGPPNGNSSSANSNSGENAASNHGEGGSSSKGGGSGSGGGSSSSAVPSISVGEKAGGSSSSNRVQAKDSGAKKSKESRSSNSNNIHNGELDASATSVGANVTEPVSKKRDNESSGSSSSKDKESTSSSRASHGKKNQKSASSVPGSSSSSSSGSKSSSIPNLAALLPPPPPPVAKTKEDVLAKPDKTSGMSSLVVKINLNKLKRKPTMMPAPPPPPPLAPPVTIPWKLERDSTDKAGKTIKEPPAVPSNNTDLFQKRVHHNSSRVGSSSDHSKDGKETVVLTHNPPPVRIPLDGSLCSDIDFRGKKRNKSKKVKSSSPKKPRTKHEPDSHSKVEEDTTCTEVSSNVLGYTTCDSVSVSTTRTPPVECEIAQAPDSSLNPPHLPSPVVPPQPVFYSYFEKNDNLEDYYSRRDQDSYLEEAKRLKHKADGERVGTTQASVYLEAGLYFILTGISMERDQNVGSTAAFTMYKDTLVLIRYIGSRFRTRCTEYSNAMEAKIIVLSMRCQSMLSLKLFKIKMGETKGMVQCLQEHFQRHPTPDMPPIASSPQLSTPSPHSPTSSPAASSSLHPSPHHPNQIMTTIPRPLYSNMQRTCSSTMHLISAHELWDAADHLVEKYRIEEFFIHLDRQFGPLTLHNSLVDLVRYVKQALQVLKSSSELS